MVDEAFIHTLKRVEAKWQDRWAEENLFEVDPNADDKFFITVAYPYPSGGMHIGHVRTYTLPDVFARFKRMQGKNVLFPMAWHVTGTPIIGALQRLQEGEEKQLETLRDVYNVPEDVLDSFEEPMDYANYFIDNSYRNNMQALGFSVDWRREFTTNDEHYHRFIEWQYKRLREQGLVKKGLHPTKYDIKTENPVTTHDLLEGEGAEKQDYTLVKFTAGETVFPCATLRPETVYGVTHIIVHPDVEYVTAEVDGQTWVFSADAAEKIDHQDHDVKQISTVLGQELIGKTATNPVTEAEVPVLPATFIDPDAGTGVVMSVPAHAPYDWISLQDLKADPGQLAEYGISADQIENIDPIEIIDVEGYDDVPAKAACEAHGVTSQNDEDALEAATQEIYESEFHNGVLNENCGRFAGEYVNAVKDELKRHFQDTDVFGQMWDFSEDVVSRSGGKVIVAMQESWFLEYGDAGWKDKVNAALDDMRLIPEHSREQYEHTVDWLESWPCIRNYGLGTRLPFDEDFVIEPLSDSTIYMAFYTIKHIIDDLDAEALEPEVFDYIFRGGGDPENIAAETGIPAETLDAARESFEYWYPLDWRTTAHELIQNHLTFMIYHHTALFGQQHWPDGIAAWGMGTLEGEKMSSSKGHVVVAEEAIEKYGADTSRFFLFASVEPWQDFDWRSEEVAQYRDKLRRFYHRSTELYGTGEDRDRTTLDTYAISRLQRIIRDTTEGLEDFQTRKAGLKAFFELNDLIKTYQRRSESVNPAVINELIETQVKLMAPFTPHICEELWAELGYDGFVSEADWPTADTDLIDDEVEASQAFIDRALEDVRDVAEIVGDFETVRIITAAAWKRDLFADLKDVVADRPEFGAAMGRLVEGRKEHGEQIQQYLQDYLNDPGELPDVVFSTAREIAILEENAVFFADEFDAEIVIEAETDSDHEKSGRAEPGRPAIVLQ